MDVKCSKILQASCIFACIAVLIIARITNGFSQKEYSRLEEVYYGVVINLHRYDAVSRLFQNPSDLEWSSIYDEAQNATIHSCANDSGERFFSSNLSMEYSRGTEALDAKIIMDYLPKESKSIINPTGRMPSDLTDISFSDALKYLHRALNDIGVMGYHIASAKVISVGIKEIQGALEEMYPGEDVTKYVENRRKGQEFYYVEIPFEIDGRQCLDLSGKPFYMAAIISDVGILNLSIPLCLSNIYPKEGVRTTDKQSRLIDSDTKITEIEMQYMLQTTEEGIVQFAPIYL